MIMKLKYALFCSGLVLLANTAMAQNAGIIWTEINGHLWSQVLRGTYDNTDLNGTTPKNGIIQDSQATEACKALGGGSHLPTRREFISIEGSDYLRKIPGITNRENGHGFYWSSQIDLNWGEQLIYAYGFYALESTEDQDPGTPNTGDVNYRGEKRPVVCVKSIGSGSLN